MRHLTLAALTAATVTAGNAGAETLKMATIEPSLGQAITMATFANVVNSNQGAVDIEVAGGGAATGRGGGRLRLPRHRSELSSLT